MSTEPSSAGSGLAPSLRIALVHDWLVTWRGGEQVLDVLAGMFPQADLFTLVADPSILPDSLRGRRLTTSWLQRLPWRQQFRWALPLFPWTVERFRFDAYDLVISISHAVAKGAVTGDTPHLCYCLTPMRYAWVVPEIYLGRMANLPWSPQRALIRYLQDWDRASAPRVHQFIAISDVVRRRIAQYYGRPASVIHPPVDCDRLLQLHRQPQGYYLVVAALVPYKRTEMAIDACDRLRKPLVIVGDGPEAPRLQRRAGPTIRFVGRQTAEQLGQWYAGAEALLYPQEEDFGIAAVEAQAAGCPVVALRRGGATETVEEGRGGVLFDAQTVEALMDAMERLRKAGPPSDGMRAAATRFDRSRFVREFTAAVAAMIGAARR